MTTSLQNETIPPGEFLALAAPLSNSDVVLLGSAPDSLAERFSDVQLIIVGDSARPTCRTTSSTGVPVCIRGYSILAVSGLLEILTSALAAIRKAARLESIDQEKLQMLNPAQISLFHNLKTGQTLSNAKKATQWRECLQDLPDFLILYYLGIHFNCREDVIAQAKYGDPLSALWMLNQATDVLSAAMLASAGETNPDPRCRPRMLRLYEAQLGKERIDKLLRYLLPADGRGNAFATVQHALSFFDVAIIELFGRRPSVANVILELRKRVKFITRFDELSGEGPRGAT